MKNAIYLLPLLFLLACEPQPFADLTLANLNGRWQVQSSGETYGQGATAQDLETLSFEISFQENAQFTLTGLGNQSLSGSYEQSGKGKLLFQLPVEVIHPDLGPLNVMFYLIENRQNDQEWQASGSEEVNNQLMYYQLFWALKRIE